MALRANWSVPKVGTIWSGMSTFWNLTASFVDYSFEQVGTRIVADIVVTDAIAGPTTINAHLYH